jgi:HPr kinase/phosphorylase
VTLIIAADRVHASAVAFEVEGHVAGLLILGSSGSGKSELALELMALGAKLVSDDQTLLHREADAILLQAPPTIRGMIEMRGLGILQARVLHSARLVAVVNLDELETQRLPEPVFAEVLGVGVPCLRNCASRAFPAGLKQYILSWVLQNGHGTTA